MKVAKSISVVNLPAASVGAMAFSFETTTADGSWAFLFAWMNGRWNAWVTLPSGEVRQAGCVPRVVNWTGFLDFGMVILSDLASLGLGDLVSVGTSLVLIAWG
jgi:hypothetical protein